MSRVRVHVSFTRPVRLGLAVVSDVGLELDHIALVADGVVVLEVPADTVSRVEVIGVVQAPAALPAQRRAPEDDGVWLAEDLDQLARAWNEGRELPDLEVMFRRSRASILAGLATVGGTQGAVPGGT